MLNIAQRFALFVGLLVITAMLLFPPWRCRTHAEDAGRLVYAWIFSPPERLTVQDREDNQEKATVICDARLELDRLAIQCLAVVTATAAMLCCFHKGR